MRVCIFLVAVLLPFAVVSCTSKSNSSPAATSAEPARSEAKSAPASPPQSSAEPDYIKVQHVLIGFKDAVGFEGHPPPAAAKRTKEEAEKLANEILERAKKGDDFGALVKQYTDDSAPGIYPLANKGKPAKGDYTPRGRMVPAFGDVGFPLKVGEIGFAVYDPNKSPYGWHIIKRVE